MKVLGDNAEPCLIPCSILLDRIVSPKKARARMIIMPSRDVSFLISSKTDLFVLLSVQGILNNLARTTIQKHQMSFSRFS